MAIPKDRLHISVYEQDDEAYDIWTKKVGIAPVSYTHLAGYRRFRRKPGHGR